jgi:predicted  nucleic acid-binding Zn-ribbon protein
LPDQQVEAEVMSGKEINTLESSLEALWEKARRVSEALVQMRESNGELLKRVEDLESAGEHLKQDLATKERELERLRQDALRLQTNGSNILTKEEKEALKARIKDLIGKINSHL